jgi:hypothetical protein
MRKGPRIPGRTCQEEELLEHVDSGWEPPGQQRAVGWRGQCIHRPLEGSQPFHAGCSMMKNRLQELLCCGRNGLSRATWFVDILPSSENT